MCVASCALTLTNRLLLLLNLKAFDNSGVQASTRVEPLSVSIEEVCSLELVVNDQGRMINLLAEVVLVWLNVSCAHYVEDFAEMPVLS